MFYAGLDWVLASCLAGLSQALAGLSFSRLVFLVDEGSRIRMRVSIFPEAQKVAVVSFFEGVVAMSPALWRHW